MSSSSRVPVAPLTAAPDDGKDGRTARAAELRRKIEDRSARLGVIGLGYVGTADDADDVGKGLHGPRLRHRPDQDRGPQPRPQLHPAPGRRPARGGGGRRDVPGDRGFPPPAGAGRPPHLRADAADAPARARHELRRRRRRGRSRRPCGPDSSSSSSRRTYPGTTDELVREILETSGLKRGRGLLPRLLARARGSGQHELRDRDDSEGRRRVSTPRLGRPRPGALRPGHRADGPGLDGPRRPRRRSSSRTSSAP